MMRTFLLTILGLIPLAAHGVTLSFDCIEPVMRHLELAAETLDEAGEVAEVARLRADVLLSPEESGARQFAIEIQRIGITYEIFGEFPVMFALDTGIDYDESSSSWWEARALRSAIQVPIHVVLDEHGNPKVLDAVNLDRCVAALINLIFIPMERAFEHEEITVGVLRILDGLPIPGGSSIRVEVESVDKGQIVAQFCEVGKGLDGFHGISGTITWDVENGLLCQIEQESDYKVEDFTLVPCRLRWTMNSELQTKEAA